MTFGRTSDNKIKIKSDGGGLRAVECACCQINPCRDCPPFLGDLQFSLSGNQVSDITEFQYDAVLCPSSNCNIVPFPANLPQRTCEDAWDAFGPGAAGTNLYSISLVKAGGGFAGLPSGFPCCWVLSLSIQGYFEYCCFMGAPDICAAGYIPPVVITSLDPRGTYNFTMFSQCKPPCPVDPPFECQDEPFEFYFTVTVS